MSDLDEIARVEENRVHEIRANITSFCIKVRNSIVDREVCISQLYEWYRKMQPCIHRYCASDHIDVIALLYALQRLPASHIGRTHSVYVKRFLEDLANIPGITMLHSKARRRTWYTSDEGYIRVISREGYTDISDILSTLIMHGIETKKIRGRLLTAGDFLERLPSLTSEQVIRGLANVLGVEYSQMQALDKTLDHNLKEYILDIAKSQTDVMQIRFDPEFSRTDADIMAKLWRLRVQEKLRLNGSKRMHIISSNTHSIVNLLTGFALDNREWIESLASSDPELQQLDFNNPSSLYFAVQKLTKTNPDLLAAKVEYEEGLGIQHVRDAHSTGIDVQLVDTSKLDYNKIDPRLRARLSGLKDCYILNIDYAFGRQGRAIMRELIEGFGLRIESISITGKAGIVCGNRYDCMLPTHFLSQIEGGTYEFPRHRNYLTKRDIASLLTGSIHTNGPILTVPGTAIQNDLVLMDYMRRDGILGLEMEGVPYLEAIQRAYTNRKRTLLDKGIKLYVAYWGSDNPLKPEESLAFDHMDRGFIPTYAICAAILSKILRT